MRRVAPQEPPLLRPAAPKRAEVGRARSSFAQRPSGQREEDVLERHRDDLDMVDRWRRRLRAASNAAGTKSRALGV